MVYFENAFCWSFFHHNLKMHGPSCKKAVPINYELIAVLFGTALLEQLVASTRL
jgi:hypothetical protein